jgi:hypothetical protein
MSYSVLSDVTNTILSVLRSNVKKVFPAPDENLEVQISLTHPKDIETSKDYSLLVFPYNFSEYSVMRNQPDPGADDATARFPSLFLALHFLFVAKAKSLDEDCRILGKVIETFVDNPVLRGSVLRGGLAGTDAQLKVTLDSLSIDDLNKLWSVLGTSYRPCLSYTVLPVQVEPTQLKTTTRVVEYRAEYALGPEGDEPNGKAP